MILAGPVLFIFLIRLVHEDSVDLDDGIAIVRGEQEAFRDGVSLVLVPAFGFAQGT